MMTRSEMKHICLSMESRYTGLEREQRWREELQAYRTEMENKLERVIEYCENYEGSCVDCKIKRQCDELTDLCLRLLNEGGKKHIIDTIMEYQR